MANVLVTLLQPWVGSKDGSVLLSLGYENSIVEDATPYARGKVIQGKRIVVMLQPEKGKDKAIIEEGQAKLYFGDWTAQESRDGDESRIVSGPVGNMRERIPTIGEQADEVARIWGDYRRASERGMKQGDPNWPSGEPIGPPPVPHVLIQSIGPSGQPDGELKYDPWEFLKFNELFAGFKETPENTKVIWDYAKRR